MLVFSRCLTSFTVPVTKYPRLDDLERKDVYEAYGSGSWEVYQLLCIAPASVHCTALHQNLWNTWQGLMLHGDMAEAVT